MLDGPIQSKDEQWSFLFLELGEHSFLDRQPKKSGHCGPLPGPPLWPLKVLLQFSSLNLPYTLAGGFNTTDDAGFTGHFTARTTKSVAGGRIINAINFK